MVDIAPISLYAFHQSYEMMKDIKLMRSLIDQYSTSLRIPLSSPRIAQAIRFVAPSQQGYLREGRITDFPIHNRLFNSLAGGIPTTLTDDPEFEFRCLRGRDHSVAFLHRQSHGFFDEHMATRGKCLKAFFAMRRMGGRDYYRVHAVKGFHFIRAFARGYVPFARELISFFASASGNRNQRAVRRSGNRQSV